MFERFTAAARNAVRVAHEQARAMGHERIGVGHLVLGTLTGEEGVARAVLVDSGLLVEALPAAVAAGGGWDDEALAAIGIDLPEVRRRAEAAFGPGALDVPPRRRPGLLRRGGHLGLTAGAKSALERALREAVARRDTYIGTEHLLLGAIGDEQAVAVLRRAGVTLDATAVRERLLAAMPRAA